MGGVEVIHKGDEVPIVFIYIYIMDILFQTLTSGPSFVSFYLTFEISFIFTHFLLKLKGRKKKKPHRMKNKQTTKNDTKRYVKHRCLQKAAKLIIATVRVFPLKKGVVTRYTHEKSESPFTIHSNVLAKVKGLTDRQTDQKLYMPPFKLRGYKNIHTKTC